MTDSITLTGITAQGTHGVLDFEKERAQTFSVDATLILDLSEAGQSDQLQTTIDYGYAARIIVDLIQGPHCDLIETLAEHIAAALLAKFPQLEKTQITVHKPAAPITVPFHDVAVTIERSRYIDSSTSKKENKEVERSVHTVVLALGSNLGNSQETLREAVVALDNLPETQVIGISPLYQTTPWGMKEGTPNFSNAVLQLTTTLEATELLQAIHIIEAAHGRIREEHWGSRTLDIDIIDFDGRISDDPFVTLPHPRAWQRAFVLAPWSDLDPDAFIPGEHGGYITDLLENCPDKNSVERISSTWILGNAQTPEESVY
ncbi:MAG: 2-amino-4-hydroxy-6-hydroxymethyldihydropteridine diphosphokinase [Aeriscardovia sp.]|nr:2-amino-4-hydroxy-6-hydroxymethyldihydropteridine diphosphokinase [Aeriscardovia sp.]